jgi:hypothetical protein
MGDVEKKVRVSGEQQRPEPTLPTVNPATEKPETPKSALHPAVYVAYEHLSIDQDAMLTKTGHGSRSAAVPFFSTSGYLIP